MPSALMWSGKFSGGGILSRGGICNWSTKLLSIVKADEEKWPLKMFAFSTISVHDYLVVSFKS